MAIQKTEAFVLRSQPFRSSSLIITVFSRTFGKIRGMVKGVRREGLPCPSTFEPFTLLEIVYYEKIHSDLHLISDSSILESFEGLRIDIESLATAYYFSELVDQLTQPHDPHEAIFELLHSSFQWLCSMPPCLLSRFFEIRMLFEVGLLPHLEGCLSCGRGASEKMYFSVKQGGVFCQSCRKKVYDAREISEGALEGMRLFTRKGWEQLPEMSSMGRSALKPEALDEINTIAERFITERLGKRLNSRKFLSQVIFLRKNMARNSIKR